MMILLEGALSLMQRGPRALAPALDASAGVNDVPPASPAELLAHLAGAPSGDDVANVFRRALAVWDNDRGTWADGTERNTAARRRRIYGLLGLDAGFVALCDGRFPFHPAEPPLVIAEEHAPWYDEAVRSARRFYWAAYARQLERQGWSEESLRQLDDSATSIVERLADPTSEKAFQAKGLVIGYVQSGKTASFTGVIAKAADAGYKLIVVMAGTLDVLRSQTQRRIDRDLVGRELLDTEYVGDADWNRFLSHGAKPSTLGSFDWHRLTGPESDYQGLRHGLEALQFEAFDPTKPLYHKDNLFLARTRIAVVKKNSRVLLRLLTDLRRLSRKGHGASLDQVPALIIDDESDQAGLNVTKPTEGAIRERTATNDAIVQLLKLLPRAQYVGYTATPFANVFVDPGNAEDIFPKDFLIALPRPAAYMGVRDFYDLDGSPEAAETRPNERHYIRPVTGEDAAAPNLPKAIDCFVLSGAMKLFREARGIHGGFRHHTMLVHQSEKVAEQKELAKLVRSLIRRAGYDGGPGVERLRKLLENDFRPVHSERGADLPFPVDMEELAPFVGQCLARIGDASLAVLVVNNEHRDETPDFDRQAVWKILVGGTKLSRGYTVEGLTVSYYRRRAQAGDTLMQMGRWFGFRQNYRDLVRLFIGTAEVPPGRRATPIDLYQAFGSVCRDEEAFRDELRRYAREANPRITPKQIPPLVPSHMMRPTAANKMYNAVVTYNNFGGHLSESTLAPTATEDILYNNRELERLIDPALLRTVDLKAGGIDFSAYVAELRPDALIRFLEAMRWQSRRAPDRDPHPMALQVEFLRQSGTSDPEIDDWILLVPLLKVPNGRHKLAGFVCDVHHRGRRDADRFGTYNDPKHRSIGKHVAGQTVLDKPNEAVRALARPRRGVMLYYPVTEAKPVSRSRPPYTVGFTLLFPRNGIREPVKFSVRRPDLRNDVIVPRA